MSEKWFGQPTDPSREQLEHAIKEQSPETRAILD